MKIHWNLVLDDAADFSHTELKVLSAFSDVHEKYTIRDLSSTSYIPLSNMTPIIKRLEKKGIVKLLRINNVTKEKGKSELRRRICALK